MEGSIVDLWAMEASGMGHTLWKTYVIHMFIKRKVFSRALLKCKIILKCREVVIQANIFKRFKNEWMTKKLI